jgi:hypothetical protein
VYGRCVEKMGLMVEVDGVDVEKWEVEWKEGRNLLLWEGSLKSFGRS